MPASAAQVFGPNTVNPGFNTTGEKTLLTMSTTLAAGGKNVILFSYMENFAFNTGGARGVLRIKKGATIIYETRITEVLNDGGTQARPKLLIAVDDAPSGNDVYVATLNITRAGSATGSVHVQAIIIKSNDAVWGYNTTGVNIASGATATVTSISTAYSSGSKVAIIGVIYGGRSTGEGRAYMGIGSNRLKSGATVVASNEFNASSYSLDYINSWVSLQYLETTSTSSQTYSLEVNNGGGVQVTMYGIIVAFTVGDGAFLDTASVALTSGSQVTVGSLSTTLAGDVVAIGLATDNFTGTGDTKGFDPGDVVLQRDNLATGQIANQVAWYVVSNTWPGTLPLFRFDAGVSNPSYQIKMTAKTSNLFGEAKILAFSLVAGVDIKRVFGETLQLLENIILRRVRFRLVSENVSISEALNQLKMCFRSVIEQINLNELSSFSRRLVRRVGEFVTLLESIISLRAINRAVNEVENLIESFLSSLSKVVGVTEGVRILELTLFSRIRVKIIGELVRISEAFSKSMNRLNIIVENVRIGEFLSLVSNKFRSFIEMVRIYEVFNGFVGVVKSMVEVVNIDEVRLRMSNIFRSVIEGVRLVEFFRSLRNRFVGVLEGINLLENVSLSKVLVRIRDEFVEVRGLFSRFIGRVRVVVENVRIVEGFLLKILKRRIRRLKSQLKGRVVGR